MRKIVIILIIGFVFTTANAQMDSPLKQGMLNTVTLSTGDVVYDLKGEWEATYYDAYVGRTPKDVFKITQEGNTFIGVSIIGNAMASKGSEAIKGELDKNGFKSVSTFLSNLDWYPSNGEISEKGNKIKVRTHGSDGALLLILTLTRK